MHVKCDIYITTNNFLIVLHWCRHRVNSIQKWKNSAKTIELIQELVILTLLGRSIIMTILTNSISIQFLHFFGFNALWARKGECWNVCWKPEHQNSLKWNLNRHLAENILSLYFTKILSNSSTYWLSKAFQNFKIFDAKEQSSFLFLLQGFQWLEKAQITQ